MSIDPHLQPYYLKHLTLKNRIMTTSHEPAYPEDGMPKDRYRAYHVERAKAGVALTMTAGSAAVSRNSPPVFNHGTLPLDELYFALKPRSGNKGAVEQDALIDGRPQPKVDGFQVFRTGDAVSARNTHAAIYDALRLIKDI